jgi:hypothetical protein
VEGRGKRRRGRGEADGNGICGKKPKAKEGKRRDKYSIRESEGDKIVQKDEETDKDGKSAEREENTKSCSEGVRRMTQIE